MTHQRLSPTEKDAGGHLHYGWVITIVSVSVVMGAIGFARFGYTIILPRMKSSLHLTDSQTGDIAMANMLGYLAFSLFCGVLASRVGHKLVIVLSLLLTGLSLFITGLARGFAGALLFRFLAGAGGGGANVPMMSLMSIWFAKSRRGLATGITVSGSSFALLISGFILPAIMRSGGDSGWSSGWYVLGGITIGLALVSAFLLKNSPRAKGLLPIGTSEDGAAPSGTTSKNDGKADNTGSPLRILRRGILWVLALIYLFFGFSYVIYATFYARYLLAELGISERTVGHFWSSIGAISIASGFLSGALSDKLGRKYALAGIFFLQTASYLLFSVAKSMPGILLSSFLFALTAFSIPAVMSAAIGDTFGPENSSTVFGLVTMIFGFGQAAGPFVAGRIAETTGSFASAYLVAASAACIGGLVSLSALPGSRSKMRYRSTRS